MAVDLNRLKGWVKGDKSESKGREVARPRRHSPCFSEWL